MPQMYYNYITGGFSNSYYGIATSATPQGPFTVVNTNVQLLHTDNGDENIFVDDDGTGYIIYTSLSVGHSISIERLTPDFLNSTLVSSGVFGESFVEVGPVCGYPRPLAMLGPSTATPLFCSLHALSGPCHVQTR